MSFHITNISTEMTTALTPTLSMKPRPEKSGKRSRLRARSRSRNAVSWRVSGVKSTKFEVGGKERESSVPHANASDWRGVLAANVTAAGMPGVTLELAGDVRSGSLSPGERARVRASVHPPSPRRSALEERGQSVNGPWAPSGVSNQDSNRLPSHSQGNTLVTLPYERGIILWGENIPIG